MDIVPLSLAGLALITPRRHGDGRGFFSEVFRQDVFEAALGPIAFVQDNHAHSAKKGTLRGLHAQLHPMAQGKLVRVTRGAVLDVAVDARRASPTFGQHVCIELSAANWHQIWIPPGFLHGYCTLTEDTELLYKVSARYSPVHERTIAFDDPDLAINWPFDREELTLSPKDLAAPRLRDVVDLF